MGWGGWKRIFWWGAGVWLSGTIILQVVRINSRSYSSMLLVDNLNTPFAILSIAVLVLGVVLFGRWAWQKATEAQIVGESQPPAKWPRPIPVTQPLVTVSTRWTALVEYDDEIRSAAEKLLPYGAEWVQRL
jgi:hypothetical protein